MAKSPVADRYKTVEKRGYDTGKPSKGVKPPPKVKFSVRPTGGLKPKGAKAEIKITW